MAYERRAVQSLKGWMCLKAVLQELSASLSRAALHFGFSR